MNASCLIRRHLIDTPRASGISPLRAFQHLAKLTALDRRKQLLRTTIYGDILGTDYHFTVGQCYQGAVILPAINPLGAFTSHIPVYLIAV